MSRELDAEVAEKVFHNTELDYPHYSDNIVDAWLVVEEMRGRGFVFLLNQIVANDEYMGYFQHERGRKYGAGNGAGTAPDAICRAALKAVG